MAADYQYRNSPTHHYEFDGTHWNHVKDVPPVFSGSRILRFLARCLTLFIASAFLGVLLGVIYDRGW